MSTVDVAIPTKDGEDTIHEALESLLESVTFAGISVGTVHIVNSNKYHDSIVTGSLVELCDIYDAELNEMYVGMSLADARTHLLNKVSTDWFVFLDDDAIVSKYYLKYCWMWTRCKRVGAVIGRKQHHKHLHPTEWVKQRSRRAGVHCLLVRSDAIRGLSYPPDITGVYEDEWMRRYIENNGYRWVFEPYAVFEHENQDRHPTGWEEGVLAGKYGFAPFYRTVLNVPYSVVKRRSPWPYMKRSAGWLYGRYAL